MKLWFLLTIIFLTVFTLLFVFMIVVSVDKTVKLEHLCLRKVYRFAFLTWLPAFLIKNGIDRHYDAFDVVGSGSNPFFFQLPGDIKSLIIYFLLAVLIYRFTKNAWQFKTVILVVIFVPYAYFFVTGYLHRLHNFPEYLNVNKYIIERCHYAVLFIAILIVNIPEKTKRIEGVYHDDILDDFHD